MTALSANQLTAWRLSPQAFPVYTYVHKPTVVFAAQCVAASTAYPASSILYDNVTTGSYTDLREGMLLTLGTTAGSDNLGRVLVRNELGTIADAAQIKITRVSQGVGWGEINITNDAYITVYDHYPVYALPPTISQQGVIFKNGSVTFSANGHQRPVANAGGDLLFIVEDALDEVTHTFGTTASFKTHPDATSTLTYSWSFPGCTPSTSTSAAPSVDIPVGKRYISLTVTDSLGNTRTARALVVVATRDDPDLLEQYTIQQHYERADGQEVIINLQQELDRSTYIDGTEVLMCTDQYTDGVGVTGYQHMIFAGFLMGNSVSSTHSREGHYTTGTLRCVDVAGRLRMLPAFPMTLERESSPTTWIHLEGCNMDRLVHHILDWHSTALDRCDFVWSGTGDTYAVQGLATSGTTLWDQCEYVSQAIAMNLTYDPFGRLRMLRNPLIAPTSAQSSTYGLGFSRTSTVQVHIQEQDWEVLDYNVQYHPKVHWNWAETLLSSTANVSSGTRVQVAFAVAPGLAPGQGMSSNQSGRQVCFSKSELSIRDGNRYRAILNMLTEATRVMTTRARRAVVPADMEYVELTVSSENSNPRKKTYAQQKFLPTEVTYTYDLRYGVRRAEITMEIDGEGTPAVVYDLPADEYSGITPIYNDIYTGINPPVWESLPSPELPFLYERLPIRLGALHALTDGFAIINLNSDFTSSATNISTGLSGNGMDWAQDPYQFSRQFVLTSTGLYKIDDIDSFSSWSLVANNATMFGDAARVGYKIRMSSNYQGYIAIACGLNMMAISFNYGASWTQVRTAGASDAYNTTTLAIPASYMDFDISPWNSSTEGHMYATYHPGLNTCRVLKSTNWGLSWTEILNRTGGGAGGSNLGSIRVPYKIGGVENRNGGSQKYYLLLTNLHAFEVYTQATLTESRALGANTVALNIPSGSQHSFTHDGNITALALASGTQTKQISVRTTSGVGFTPITGISNTYISGFALGGNPAVGISGFSFNSQWLTWWTRGFGSNGGGTVAVSRGILISPNLGTSVYIVTPSFWSSGHTAAAGALLVDFQ